MLLTCFLIFAVIHLLFWVVLFSKLSLKNDAFSSSSSAFISVVVVFKNEDQNLKQLIPKLLSQDYPYFEIILCDDFSTDGSYNYLKSIEDNKVKVIKAMQNLPGKKQALTEAVAQASGDYILVTDADCYPISDSWVSLMANHVEDKQFLLGYSPHLKSTGWLNKFIRYETYLTALQYLSYALAKVPYMGVGRNMLYKKEVFTNSNALLESSDLVSGDDDIFVNAEATGENTKIILNENSFVYTYPSKNLGAFFKQKSRHITTSTVYKLHHKILLGLYSISHFLLYSLGIYGLLSGPNQIILIVVLIVLIIKWMIASKTMSILACKDLILVFPILDFMMACYYVILAPSIFFKTKSW